MSFWHELNKPILVLAPMEDVTDAAFRYVISKYGKPDVIFTEFASVDGLCSVGKDRILKDLTFTESERPIVAQLFGSNPDLFYQSAQIIKDLGFDGIDINMGCPDKDVIKNGAGSALINQPELAKNIVRATKAGAGEIPVSVKTRIGYSTDQTTDWIPQLLKAKPAAISLHGRTKKEMFSSLCHWESIKLAADIARESGTLIIGNGGIRDREEAIKLANRYQLDGVMIGQAAFGNPWFFNADVKKADLQLKQIVSVLIEHAEIFEKLLGDTKSFINMRKHFAWYLKGIPNAKELKNNLMKSTNLIEAKQIVQELKKQNYAFHPVS